MGEVHSPSAILALGTAVPQNQFDQAAIGQWMAEALEAPPGLRRWMRRLYELSGIETRYSCLSDPARPPSQSRFAPGRALADMPTTAERMEIYRHAATELGTVAAERALADFDPARPAAEVAGTITHLIVVSCTGFFAPGLDLAIARQLGLRPNVARTLVGFMGCAAAFNGLRLAQQIVAGQPAARVLVVCVEICSLHIQSGEDRIKLVVGSLFADGAAACLVGVAPPDRRDVFVIDTLYSEVAPDTEQDMVWQIGNHGFNLHLSPDIPKRLSMVAPGALASLLDGRPRPRFWAIHPGGRAIVDRLIELFGLEPDQVAATFEVLRHYGNMSSPTILFVLNELRAQIRRAAAGEPIAGVAMAFGPGLVVEMAHLTYLPPLEVLASPALAAPVAALA